MKRRIVFIIILIISIMLLLAGCSINDSNSNREPIEETKPPEYLISIKYYANGSSTFVGFNDYSEITLTIPKAANGYSFLGWATAEGVLITENNLSFLGEHKTIELYAQWQPTSYIVELDCQEGVLEGNGIIIYDIETPTFSLPTPTRQGYTFIGWQNSIGSIIDNIAQGNYGNIGLKAIWQAKEYSINYNLDGGACDNLVDSYTVETPTITLPNPTKKGTNFIGWYNNANFIGDKITTINTKQMTDIELYARWKIIDYTIEYHLGDGYAVGLPTRYNYYSGDIDLTSYHVAKAKFKFQGFYNSNDAMGAPVTSISHTMTENIILYAAWTDSDTTSNVAFSYHDNGEGGYYSARAIGNNGNYVVPNIYKNKPVLSIDEGGFKELHNSSVTVKGGVTAIGDYAFMNSQSTTITIAYGAKTLGVEAISNCKNISAIIPGSLAKGLGNGVFMNNTNSTFALGYGIATIPDNAFNGFVGEKITLPTSVEKIGDHSLSNIKANNDSGVSITMGGNIKYFGKIVNSRISTIDMNSRQDFVPHSFIKQLYYIDKLSNKLYMTNIVLTNAQLQGIAQTLYSVMLGFSNPRFRAELECKSLLSDRESIVGHFSMSHPEQVCLRVKYSDNNREKIFFNLGTMNTMTHEVRHYFQKLHVHGSINGVSKDSVPKVLRPTATQVADWHKPYINDPYSEYYHQPVEEDARYSAYLLTGYTPYHTPCDHPKCSELGNQFPSLAFTNVIPQIIADTKQWIMA